MYGDYWVDSSDNTDELFNRLNEIVELAEEFVGKRRTRSDLNPKYDCCSLSLINLMMDEVGNTRDGFPHDIHLSKQGDGSWEARVIYRGITFIHIAVQKPAEWELWEETQKLLEGIR